MQFVQMPPYPSLYRHVIEETRYKCHDKYRHLGNRVPSSPSNGPGRWCEQHVEYWCLMQLDTILSSDISKRCLRCRPTYPRPKIATFISPYTLPRLQPIRATRVTNKSAHPAIITLPANICAPMYFPSSFCISAPARGDPVRHAKLITLKHIPILTPAFFRSVVKLVSVAGKRPWIPAANIPYTTAKAMSPFFVDTAAQQ